MTTAPKTAQIIVVHETIAQSWARDASSFALFTGLIGVGTLLESSAMQWVGAIIGFGVIAVRASGLAPRMTIDQARHKLNEIEAGRDV